MSRPATARLFIALDPPQAICEELAGWARGAAAAAPHDARGAARASGAAGARERRGERPSQGMRLIPAADMHITVCFLGSRSVEEIEPLRELVERSEQPWMADASIGAPLWLPPRRPRALAVEVHDDAGAIAAVHRVVRADLDAAGLAPAAHGQRAGHRAFRPHITLARLRAGSAPGERALPPTPQRAFPVRRLVLYRSWLSPEGASYEPLAVSAIEPGAQAA